MPAAQKRDTGLGQDLNQFGLTSRNSDMELGTSNDGIGTALNIFGVTLLALLDPAEAIRAFLENLKGSGSKEVCEGADAGQGLSSALKSTLSSSKHQHCRHQLMCKAWRRRPKPTQWPTPPP